jgi:hypothetical protein
MVAPILGLLSTIAGAAISKTDAGGKMSVASADGNVGSLAKINASNIVSQEKQSQNPQSSLNQTSGDKENLSTLFNFLKNKKQQETDELNSLGSFGQSNGGIAGGTDSSLDKVGLGGMALGFGGQSGTYNSPQFNFDIGKSFGGK